MDQLPNQSSESVGELEHKVVVLTKRLRAAEFLLEHFFSPSTANTRKHSKDIFSEDSTLLPISLQATLPDIINLLNALLGRFEKPKAPRIAAGSDDPYNAPNLPSPPEIKTIDQREIIYRKKAIYFIDCI
ncbi:MAG: hypothetical protein EZS28_003316 [Streblomastix strix]|uniref:Uncharacterized protein n=1 Tax=Streblomastix strix TaxID=222440 RepID=A0A5J4X3D7_9EUKA|nr:MAG: hypothetical protein EZS28_003316 [Streblomastix strix]